jgi:hypothetical protein
MQWVQTYGSPLLQLAASNVQNALQNAVLQKTADRRSSSGLSILLPDIDAPSLWNSKKAEYLNDHSEFVRTTKWDTFLDRLMQGTTVWGGWNDFTGLNTQPYYAFSFRDVSGGRQVFRELHTGESGVEWYQFQLSGTGATGDDIRITSDQHRVSVFAAETMGVGTPVREISGTAANRRVDLAGLARGEYLIRVQKTGETNSPYDLAINVATKGQVSDIAARNDTQLKSRNLGLVVSDEMVSGFRLNAGTEDWFEFQTPRFASSTNQILKIRLTEGASAYLELFVVDQSTGQSRSLASKQGSNELSLEFKSGDAAQYQFVVRPLGAVQDTPYHVVFDSRGSHRYSWTNPNNPQDVNEDNNVSSLDVLVLVNDINRRGARQLSTPKDKPTAYLDVNADGAVSSLDVLMLVNALNRKSRNGEGEKADSVNQSIDQFFASWNDSLIDDTGEEVTRGVNRANRRQLVFGNRR